VAPGSPHQAGQGPQATPLAGCRWPGPEFPALALARRWPAGSPAPSSQPGAWQEEGAMDPAALDQEQQENEAPAKPPFARRNAATRSRLLARGRAARPARGKIR